MNTTCNAKSHNTLWAYSRRGCRCPEAVEAERAYARIRNAQRSRAERPRSGGWGYDWVKVERAVNGDTSFRLSFPELAAAIDRLERRSAEEVAVRLGITQRTVQRRRSAHHEAVNRIAAALAGRRNLIPTPTERSSHQEHRTAHPRQDQAA